MITKVVKNVIALTLTVGLMPIFTMLLIEDSLHASRFNVVRPMSVETMQIALNGGAK